jgi:hypothetical protein
MTRYRLGVCLKTKDNPQLTCKQLRHRKETETTLIHSCIASGTIGFLHGKLPLEHGGHWPLWPYLTGLDLQRLN